MGKFMKPGKLRLKTGKMLEKMEYALKFVEAIEIYSPNKTSPLHGRGSRRVILQRKMQELTWQ
jgi:hypothetical protein